MGLFKGWLYCILWYASILSGYAGLFCPLLPLLFISNKLYRYCTDILFTYWQYYPTALLEILCGCDIQVTGDKILTEETSLLIMNHRTRTDWNFLWPTYYHSIYGKNRYRHSFKFVLKDVIRHIPGPGWVMQLACFIYLKRNWMSDKLIIEKALDYFCRMSYKYCLLLFPEGTDLTESTKQHSDNYADQMGYSHYDYVLHPKSTGFSFIAHQLLERNALDAIYDMTLIYPDLIPQNEKVLLKGQFPKEVKIHLTRYPKEILPKSRVDLQEFLMKRWSDKEKILKEYYATGNFLHGQILKREKKYELYLALIFWSLLPLVVLYFFVTVQWFRHLVLAHSITLIVINLISGGFQNFEIALYNFKKVLF